MLGLTFAASAQAQTAFTSLSAENNGRAAITAPAPSKPAAPKTAKTPLKEPVVTAYISDQTGLDGSLCQMWKAKLYTTADPATRDLALSLIAEDVKLDSLVQLTKAAAKDPAVKDLARQIEAKRPDLGGKVVLTIAKADAANIPVYGVRIGYIRGGNALSSIPVYYALCNAHDNGYMYNQYSPVAGGHLCNNDPSQLATGDVLKSVQKFINTTDLELTQELLTAKVLGALAAIEAKIPAQDSELSK